MVMDADGSNKMPLTNSLWEDAMPTCMFAPGYMLALFVPLKAGLSSIDQHINVAQFKISMLN
jgi:hypothetical protein